MKAAPIKVSIIMPVYNAGPHFRPCIESLVNQTIKEIEIIIVLDCPTDGTDKIAKEYAARDKRIILISNDQNIHIGLSRNRGLEFANGEYIAFSDHDDVRELNMYEELYNEAKKDDLDVCGVNAYCEVRDFEPLKLIQTHWIENQDYMSFEGAY